MSESGNTLFRPAIEGILRWFNYDHLSTELQQVSRAFAELAGDVAKRAPFNAETTVALRKLLEAKDAAVRAAIDK